MNKFLVGLVVSASLVACADSPDDRTPGVDDHMFTVNGRTFTVEEGRGVAQPPLASFKETNVVAGCWVVLDYCVSPSTGGPVCHFTNCTIERAIEACDSLIDSHC
jgi:hypothetical protein